MSLKAQAVAESRAGLATLKSTRGLPPEAAAKVALKLVVALGQ